MKIKAEKIKVPSLKLPYAVIERNWQGDGHPDVPRLCSYDRLVATFSDLCRAGSFAHMMQFTQAKSSPVDFNKKGIGR